MSGEFKKVAIYARVSTEEQAERDLSIPFQLERCRYHAQGKMPVLIASMFCDMFRLAIACSTAT